MKQRFLTLIFTLLSAMAVAQTDNLFWFAAPDVSSDHGDPPKNGAPIYLHITAVLPTTVTISQPANPAFTPIVVTLDEMEHYTLQLNAIMGIDQIENYPQPLPQPPASIQKKAFKITSAPGDITVYYELDNYYNRDIFPLKGRNALGKDFVVSTQNFFPNGNYAGTAWSGFVVAATENNTRIVVYPTDDWLYFNTNPGDSIVFYLNAGETFAFRAEATAANRHINGTRVKSNKNIVVTLYDDSIRKKNTLNANCNSNISYDIIGDQTVPVGLIGYEYIVMKGQITNVPLCDGGERIFITSTKPNTKIYIDGVLVTTLANAGMVFNYQINNSYVHVEASEPVYINHTTGFGGELGGAVLPTIDGCTGSYDVTFTRTPNTNDAFFLNIMVRNDTTNGSPKKNQSVKNFSIISNGIVSHIPENYFDYILDSTWAVLKKTAEVNAYVAGKILPGQEARVSNSIARFHLGVINGGTATGCKYGYFSDYSSDYANAGIGGANAIKQKTYCSFDPIHLVANGGIAYKWTCQSNPADTSRLSSTTVADPFFSPEHGGFFKFNVQVTRECFGDTTLTINLYVVDGPVALFDVETAEGCSPFKALFTNKSDTVRAVENYWNFDTRYNHIVHQSSLTNPFTWDFPENITDSVQQYTVRLTVKGEFGMCPNTREKIIKVKPNIHAGFIADKNVGCTPLPVHFSDTSLGVIDTLNSYWDFVTYQQTYTPDLSFTFANNHSIDTTYNVKLIAYSKFGCIDTAVYPVTVHPFINATFGVTSLTSCSPFSTTVNPFGSVGVDTFHWTIHDQHGLIMDSLFTRTTNNSFVFNHNDATQPNPDTLYIEMYGTSDYGCADTAVVKKLIIYPEVHALFSASDHDICDSVNIDFTNSSLGYRLLHQWDLGDGTFIADTTGSGFTHRYFNRTGSSKDYLVTLITTSDYFCSDTLKDTITVYPFIKANFAIDYSNNCSPLNVEIINISKGGSEFNWDFGDGNTTTTFVPDTMFHLYENNTDNDTTFFIRLRAQNLQGCADSLERSVSLFPQVVAAFSFDSPDQGCNPLNVSFINNSRGKNLDHTWDFGDKTYSTSANPPPKIYKNSTPNDTTYYVTLTVMNLAGCDSSVTHPVQVYSKVSADFAIARLDSCSPFKIAVSNFSSGGITDFVWKYTPDDSLVLHDFSDPDIPVYHNPTTTSAKYAISLITRNLHGCTAAKSDTITVFPEIHASFIPDVLAGCQPLQVNFVNNSNIINGTSFFWDFDDGRYSNLVTPLKHEFANLTNLSQDHDVHLEATSQYGCFDDTTITVQVYPYIYAKYSIDRPAICSDELFSIDRNSSRGAINHYYWDFENDGTNDGDIPDAIFDHTYTNTGNANLDREIRLTVTNTQGCDTSWTEKITVYPQVRAAFDLYTSEVCYPQTIIFTNLSEPAIPLTYYWDFGDGSSSVQEDPQHLFRNFSHTSDKSYMVNLTAISEYGCDSTVSRLLTIHPKPLADFTYPLAVDCPPFSVPFTSNSQGASLDYNWDFDNGNTSNLANPTEVFYNHGAGIEDKNISLVVVTDFACSDTAIKPISIYPGVEVDFTASSWNGCNPLEIAFDGTATNENEYYWLVDGQVFSNYQDPSYRFVNETGVNKTFDVLFRAVTINGCSADTIKQITVYPKPVAEFLPSPQVQEFNTATDITAVTMNNLTANRSAWKYAWDFGDGTTSLQADASFIKNYTVWGDIHDGNRIPVNLIVANTANPECADTIMHYVIINPPLPQVDLGPDVSGCMPLMVQFPSTTKYNYSDSYEWDFGYEGLTSADSKPAPLVYNTAGVYIIRLAVQGDGGSGWDYKMVTVYPKPVVDFSFNPDYVWVRSQTEEGTPVKFFNTTKEGSTYLWEFGDGEISSEFQPSHEYMEVGTYYITLTAESIEGCVDKMISEEPVVVDGRGKLEFPNVFTIIPDAAAEEYYDPGNPDPSIFRPVAEGVEKYRLEIYNRWGELIFVSEDVNKGWNGFIKGEPVKQDVYVWRVTAMFTNGKPFVKAGDVTVLIRQPGH
jgi:PKD repeat protein